MQKSESTPEAGIEAMMPLIQQAIKEKCLLKITTQPVIHTPAKLIREIIRLEAYTYTIDYAIYTDPKCWELVSRQEYREKLIGEWNEAGKRVKAFDYMVNDSEPVDRLKAVSMIAAIGHTWQEFLDWHTCLTVYPFDQNIYKSQIDLFRATHE